MSFAWNLFTIERICILFLIGIALAIITAIACSVLGCNTELIEDIMFLENQTQREIDELESEIIGARHRLDNLPLTDMERVDLEALVASKENDLKTKQASLGRLVKRRESAQTEDDTVFGDLTTAAREVTPLGYGGFVVALLSLGRNILKSRVIRNLVETGQPLYDKLSQEDQDKMKDTRPKAVNKAVKSVKENSVLSRI